MTLIGRLRERGVYRELLGKGRRGRLRKRRRGRRRRLGGRMC